jgi:hypothetical protein
MSLADQWRHTLAELPADWGEATVDVTVPRAEQRSRAGALLGPASPGRRGDSFRIGVSRAGGGIGPEGLSRLLARLDGERIRGTLTLVTAAERPQAVVEVLPRVSLAQAWAEAVDALPPDWNSALCELELTSTDHLDRAALLTAPLNPVRLPGRATLRFRAARAVGYGASSGMALRCLTRLDEADIPGRVTVTRALSETDDVATQGPVWRVGGKAV